MSDQIKNRKDELDMPEFKCNIPVNLLGKLSDIDRYIIETMSKIENQAQWMATLVAKNDKAIDVIDGKIDTLTATVEAIEKRLTAAEPVVTESHRKIEIMWDWHHTFSGKWLVVWALVLIVLPLVLKFVLDMLVKRGP